VDTKTLNLDFGNGDPERISDLLRQMGEFVAYFEGAQNQMQEWRRSIETSLVTHQAEVKQQVDEIHEAIHEFRELTANEMGIARLRQTMRDVLAEGEAHVKVLQEVGDGQIKELQTNNEQIRRLAKKSFDRLDRASNFVVKNISESVSSFRIGEFKRLTDESRTAVEEISVSTIKRLRDMVKWFHWKNLALAGAITVIVTLTMGLYLNDEMPWEIHSKVVMQRNAGQALINAWPSLSQLEKQRIMEHAKKAII